MIVKKFRRALFTDFIGQATWFEPFYDLFNQIADYGTALQNNLRFVDNHRCDKRTVRLKHNTETTVNSSLLTGQIELVLVGKSPELSKPLYWRGNGLGSVVVKASFEGAPTEPQEITLYLFE